MNITEAWESAERTCFDSLLDALGAKENREAFLGYLPADQAPVFMFTSGGKGDSFGIERAWGDNPLWCYLDFAARIEGLFETRQEVVKHGSQILAWLKETTNMRETANVMWLRLSDMPQEPTPEPHESGVMLWRSVIQLELVFKTDSEY